MTDVSTIINIILNDVKIEHFQITIFKIIFNLWVIKVIIRFFNFYLSLS